MQETRTNWYLSRSQGYKQRANMEERCVYVRNDTKNDDIFRRLICLARDLANVQITRRRIRQFSAGTHRGAGGTRCARASDALFR